MSDNRSSAFPPSINAGKLYERTSAKGTTYLTGYFGSFKITVFKTDDLSDKGDPVWRLTFGETQPRDNSQRSKTADDHADAPRGRRPLQQPLGTPPNDEIPF